MKDKAIENIEAGEWAESKQYYHIAISRYYYSLYQKLLHINAIKDLKLSEGISKEKNSHKELVGRFITHYEPDLSDIDTVDLNKIKNLRRLRNDEEYKPTRFVNNTNYNSRVKEPFIKINRILDDIITRR